LIDIDDKMFSVAAVQSAFHEALVQDQDVDVKNYVLAYQELCKYLSSPLSALMIHFKRHYSCWLFFCCLCRFCSHLGGLFSFVVNDLEDKIGCLNQLVTEDELHFSTVQNMLNHEISNELVFSGRSGSVTLLRLHRGLGKTSNWHSIFISKHLTCNYFTCINTFQNSLFCSCLNYFNFNLMIARNALLKKHIAKHWLNITPGL